MRLKQPGRAASLLPIACAVIFFQAPVAISAPAITPVAAAPVELQVANFSMVASNFYRGGQPDAVGLKQLKEAGVAVDVSFDNEKKLVRQERAQAQQLGLQFINIPLSPFKQPSDTDIARFLSIVDRKDSNPVFVHCVHGRDRTGAMVAIYRLQRDGWSADQAYEEMRAKGFRPFFTRLANRVFDIGAALGRPSHKPSAYYVATHLAGTAETPEQD